MSRDERTTYVYIITHAEGAKLSPPVKVGIATDVQQRLNALQIGNPAKLAIAAQFACPNREIALALEGAFHKVKRNHSVRGEWFDIDVFVAVRAMCANIRAYFKNGVGFDDEEMAVGLEASGVTEIEAILKSHGVPL